MLLALKDLEAISIERKDGRAASETKSLIAHLSKWSFLLSVFIWYDILFQVNKASKILQSYGVSLHTMETEIQATEKFLQNYRTTGYDSAATSAVEIAQELDIDPSFPPSKSGKKRRLFDYQGEEEQRATPELKFKSNFFYPLVDQAIMSIKERFNLLRNSICEQNGVIHNMMQLQSEKIFGVFHITNFSPGMFKFVPIIVYIYRNGLQLRSNEI